MKKISIGLIAGAILGMIISAYFVNDYTFGKIIYTKITLSSIITGVICGFYSNMPVTAFKLFIGCLFIGAAVFYIKYLITGHDYDPINMGTLTGAVLGFLFYAMRTLDGNHRNEYKI
mgnify:CR=1 FL=1|tara:strand:- start:3674 stop:4024 length:351 start_codon:yes stop_codon:yes gene_type:complete